MSALSFNIFIPDYDPPVLSNINVHPVSTSVALILTTNENTGTIYYLVDQNPLTTYSNLKNNGATAPVTESGQQDVLSTGGIIPQTNYYIHVMHEDEQGNSSIVSTTAFTTPVLETGLIVYNDTELLAAITANVETTIRVAPGIYQSSDIVDGIDRTANPLTIVGQNQYDPPIFLNTTQLLRHTRYVTFQYLWMKNDGSQHGDSIVFDDGGFSGFQNGCSFINVLDCKITSPPPINDIYDDTPTATFSTGLNVAIRFANWQTHSYKIIGNEILWVHQVGDISFNGNVEITHNKIHGWYFDGIRIIGQPEEGRVAGDKYFAYNDISGCVGGYNEVTAKSPHPDCIQGFNAGGDVNNTNPENSNVLFYRNRFCPSNFRARSVQCGLTQSKMVNCSYIQNIFATKGNVHGISLEGGSDGVLIQQNTLVEATWTTRAWIRTFYGSGQVKVTNTIYRYHDFKVNHSRENFASFEYEEQNNYVGEYVYGDLFKGQANPATIELLVETFTPRDDYEQYGALTKDGEWKNNPHAPLSTDDAPLIVGGAGTLTVGTIPEPTLQTDYQASLGGDTYIRRDLRYSIADSNVWTEVLDVAVSAVVNVPAGTYYVQTRCVNSYDTGLWSPKATVTVT